jgi:predicted nuclease of restriction endonuclease-like RecB superfamily
MNPSRYPQITGRRSKPGKRADLNGQFFRSSWEANYARYLNWLISLNQLLRWEFEPDTFEFHTIKRGSRFYTPDFKVFENDGRYAYHEVKGWMDPKSQTKLNRMAKYYPNEKVILIDKVAYRSIEKQMKNAIPNWE